MKKPIAYIAGPLGFSEAGRLFHYNVLIPAIIESGFDIRDPWKLTPEEISDPVFALPYGQEKREALRKLDSIFGENNAKAIEECDIIIGVLDGPDVDSGTAGEIGFGTALGKTTLGYRNDFRLSSENDGTTVNLQIEYFIRRNGGSIAKDIDSLKKNLVRYKESFSSL